MNPIGNFFRRFWSWLKIRLLALWELLSWIFDMICCCKLCIDDDNIDAEKGITHIHTSDIQPTNIVDGHKKLTMDAAGSTANGQVHKVIMVGSGGVGKSALTLQFMYDEVSFREKIFDQFFSRTKKQGQVC